MTDKKEKKEVLINKDWNNIHEANQLINTIELKGKQYAEVKERVIAFRRVHPLGQIITDLSFTDNYVNCEAVIFDENGVMLAKGHAREYLKNPYALERAETSSIGRGLGFCGFGINTSIASADDMQEVDKPSEIFDEPPVEELVKKVTQLLTKHLPLLAGFLVKNLICKTYPYVMMKAKNLESSSSPVINTIFL